MVVYMYIHVHMYICPLHVWLIHPFLRGDFKVMFPGQEAEFTAGVFFLLENACNELARVSYQLQKRLSDGQLHGKNTTGARTLYSGFVYSRMLWGTLLNQWILCQIQQVYMHDMYMYSTCTCTCNVIIVDSKNCSFFKYRASNTVIIIVSQFPWH